MKVWGVLLGLLFSAIVLIIDHQSGNNNGRVEYGAPPPIDPVTQLEIDKANSLFILPNSDEHSSEEQVDPRLLGFSEKSAVDVFDLPQSATIPWHGRLNYGWKGSCTSNNQNGIKCAATRRIDLDSSLTLIVNYIQDNRSSGYISLVAVPIDGVYRHEVFLPDTLQISVKGGRVFRKENMADSYDRQDLVEALMRSPYIKIRGHVAIDGKQRLYEVSLLGVKSAITAVQKNVLANQS